MTLEDFISRVQNYYGVSYHIGQQEAIVEYLGAKTPEYLSALYKTCLLRFSSKWKTVPDIAIFEEVRDEVLQRMREYQRSVAAEEPILIEEREISREEALENLKKLKEMIAKIEREKRFPRAETQTGKTNGEALFLRKASP